MSGKTPSYDSGARFRDTWGESNFHNVTEDDRQNREKNADKLNESYYDFITDHYQSGWGDKFHFCGYQPGESWEAAQARHEHYLAFMTGIKPWMRVLDVGCGIGGPAREIAVFTGAQIVGVTINELHVQRGTQYNKEASLSDQIQIVKGNFLDLPFPDESFDAAYATEALCGAGNMTKAYSEVFRVLKPGALLGNLDWVLTPQYDHSNAKHRRIRSEIERGGSVPSLSTAEAHKAELRAVGFDILVDQDRALAKANPVPWWFALDGRHATTIGDKWASFMLSERAFNFVWWIFKLMHLLRLTHLSRMEALDTVAMCVYSCRDGGKEGIFSPMHLFLCKKPEKNKDT